MSKVPLLLSGDCSLVKPGPADSAGAVQAVPDCCGGTCWTVEVSGTVDVQEYPGGGLVFTPTTLLHFQGTGATLAISSFFGTDLEGDWAATAGDLGVAPGAGTPETVWLGSQSTSIALGDPVLNGDPWSSRLSYCQLTQRLTHSLSHNGYEAQRLTFTGIEESLGEPGPLTHAGILYPPTFFVGYSTVTGFEITCGELPVGTITPIGCLSPGDDQRTWTGGGTPSEPWEAGGPVELGGSTLEPQLESEGMPPFQLEASSFIRPALTGCCPEGEAAAFIEHQGFIEVGPDKASWPWTVMEINDGWLCVRPAINEAEPDTWVDLEARFYDAVGDETRGSFSLLLDHPIAADQDWALRVVVPEATDGGNVILTIDGFTYPIVEIDNLGEVSGTGYPTAVGGVLPAYDAPPEDRPYLLVRTESGCGTYQTVQSGPIHLSPYPPEA